MNASLATPDVSILIVSWNTRELIARCLSALEHTGSSSGDAVWRLVDGVRCEVVLVDNASGDGTVDMVRQRFPWVTVISNTENVGFARGCNQALRASTGRYVLLLNPDTEVQPGALGKLVHFLETHPRVGAVGPRLLNTDGTFQLSVYREPTLSRELWRLLHLDTLLPYGSYRPTDWALNEPRAVD